MGEIVAVVNQKGGVGKTTTAVNLAACLGQLDQKVLLVDVDPQGNASSGLGISIADDEQAGLYLILFDGSNGSPVSRETFLENLRVLPACSDLAGAEVELAGDQSRTAIRNSLVSLSNDFDFLILDTPPSLGILTVNSLVAARWLVIPVQCEYYALEGLRQLTRTVELVRHALNPDLEILGLVRTMFDSRTCLSQQVSDELKTHFTSLLFDTVIPRTVRLSEAPSYGQPIIRYDPRSSGAKAYQALAIEFLERFGKAPPIEFVQESEEQSEPVVTVATNSEGEREWRKEVSVEDWLL